jgi:hypothetical protein
MPITYEPIATYTTGAGESTVTFNTIPQTYTDIIAVASSGTSTTGQDFRVRVGNGSIDTNANYSSLRFGSNRTTNTSAVAQGFYAPNANYIGSAFIVGFGESIATSIFQFNYYANTIKEKSILFQTGDAEKEIVMGVGRWSNGNAAINTIQFYHAVSTYTAGSVFTLYGILRA